MYAKAFLIAALLSSLAVGNPVPGKNRPITDKEWEALKSGGLKNRAPGGSVNVPITEAKMKALRDAGLAGRSDGLAARDKVMNCGHLVSGIGGSDGHGKWIPVSQFRNVANEFCTWPMVPFKQTGFFSVTNSYRQCVRWNRHR